MRIHSKNEPTPQPQKINGWLITKISVGVMLVLLGLAMIFNQQLSAMYIKHQTKPTNYLSVSAAEMKKNAAQAKRKGNFNSDSAAPVSAYNLLKASMSKQKYTVIGGISIPDLKINLPILSDDGEYSMFYGAGPLRANQEMGTGNYTLASHDMWTNAYYYSNDLLFSPLKRAKVGQQVYLTDKNKVYQYQIESVQRIYPTDWNKAVDWSKDKAPITTLITCDTNDKYRIMVRAKYINSTKFNQQSAKPFEGQYNQYWK